MARFRVFRMKENPKQQFRWAPHMAGAASVKPKDYEEAGSVDAANEYEAWQAMRADERPLQVGDILETPTGELRICKYVGFEPAQWVVPDMKTDPENAAPAGPASQS